MEPLENVELEIATDFSVSIRLVSAMLFVMPPEAGGVEAEAVMLYICDASLLSSWLSFWFSISSVMPPTVMMRSLSTTRSTTGWLMTVRGRDSSSRCGFFVVAILEVPVEVGVALVERAPRGTTRTATLAPSPNIVPRLRCVRSEEHTSELQSQFHLVC